MVMVDSGRQISNGYENFHSKYSSMLDTALAREPLVKIVATGKRTGNALLFDIDVTNMSDLVLGDINFATVSVIVYEQFETISGNRATNRYVRSV